jgi:hypothetical protein
VCEGFEGFGLEEEIGFHVLQCLLYISWTSIMGNNNLSSIFFGAVFGCLFVMSLCEGFRILGWKKLLVSRFAILVLSWNLIMGNNSLGSLFWGCVWLSLCDVFV